MRAIYRPKHIAHILQVERETIYKWIKIGKIPPFDLRINNRIIGYSQSAMDEAQKVTTVTTITKSFCKVA